MRSKIPEHKWIMLPGRTKGIENVQECAYCGKYRTGISALDWVLDDICYEAPGAREIKIVEVEEVLLNDT